MYIYTHGSQHDLNYSHADVNNNILCNSYYACNIIYTAGDEWCKECITISTSILIMPEFFLSDELLSVNHSITTPVACTCNAKFIFCVFTYPDKHKFIK